MAIFAKIDFRGLQYHPEVLVELKTCSTICGAHVQTILNHNNLTRSAGGVWEGQNMAEIKSFWFKMVCTCVPHIVLRVLSSTSTSGWYCRPRKSILAKIGIFGCFCGLFTPPLGCHFGDVETCNA